jgi:hypothetical protein
MDMSDTMTRPKYDRGHYPLSGKNPDGDGRKRWAPIPLKSRKDVAVKLVEELLTGEMRTEALHWVRRRRYTPDQLENFIKNMRRGLEARAKEQEEVLSAVA